MDDARSEWSRAIAERVAADLGRSGPVESLGASVNSVYRSGDLVIRVSSGAVDGDVQIAMARCLSRHGLVVAAPTAGALRVEGATVTVWEHVESAPGEAFDFFALGRTIRSLHDVPAERLMAVTPLPRFDEADWIDVERHLAAVVERGVADDVVVAALRQAWAGLGEWRRMAGETETVVCHGDVHPRNVLMRGGEVVVIDWDGICIGPPAWDHAALLTWEERWGGEPGTYEAFAAGYGRDLRHDPLARILAQLRLIAPTVNMILRGATSEPHAEEAHARLRYWLGDPAAPMWTPQ